MSQNAVTWLPPCPSPNTLKCVLLWITTYLGAVSSGTSCVLITLKKWTLISPSLSYCPCTRQRKKEKARWRCSFGTSRCSKSWRHTHNFSIAFWEIRSKYKGIFCWIKLCGIRLCYISEVSNVWNLKDVLIKKFITIYLVKLWKLWQIHSSPCCSHDDFL